MITITITIYHPSMYIPVYTCIYSRLSLQHHSITYTNTSSSDAVTGASLSPSARRTAMQPLRACIQSGLVAGSALAVDSPYASKHQPASASTSARACKIHFAFIRRHGVACSVDASMAYGHVPTVMYTTSEVRRDARRDYTRHTREDTTREYTTRHPTRILHGHYTRRMSCVDTCMYSMVLTQYPRRRAFDTRDTVRYSLLSLIAL